MSIYYEKFTTFFLHLSYFCHNICRDVDKKIISLPEICETGEYVAELKLHLEVIARLRLNVYAN